MDTTDRVTILVALAKNFSAIFAPIVPLLLLNLQNNLFQSVTNALTLTHYKEKLAKTVPAFQIVRLKCATQKGALNAMMVIMLMAKVIVHNVVKQLWVVVVVNLQLSAISVMATT